MAVHGKKTELWLDGLDLSVLANKADVSIDVDTAETSVFKSDWKNNIVGAVGGTVSVGGYYDYLQTTIEDLLPASGSVLTIGPGGMATFGDRARLVSALSTSHKKSSPVGGVVAYDWAVIADGRVGLGQVYHPLAARTTTGTGTSIDGAASTTNGAIAHLHLTAISGAGASITVKLQDSADNGSFADIASGGFTAAAASGGQRLVIPGTIRRYVRAAWTISGAGPSCTFGVAFARLP